MLISLADLPRLIPNLPSLKHVDKIKLFAWYLHTQQDKQFFNASDIKQCYRTLALEEPANMARLIESLTEKNPKEVLSDRQGFQLERRIRDSYAQKYGQRSSLVQIHGMLEQLPGQVSDNAERNFLNEAIICLKHGAPRAAIIMSWNLAYDHLCTHIINHHLTAYNAQWPKRFPDHHQKRSKGNTLASITQKDEFSEWFRENEVIEIAKSANIINSNMFKILDEKLKRRNIAAHPNSVSVTTVSAEDMILDLIENVVLKLPI